MAIKIQGTTIINDETAYIDLAGTGGIKVPGGTTAQRPTAVVGQMRFNSELATFEGYNGAVWGAIGGGGDEFARTFALLAI
jgi:hypothetical protein